tara:strand:- start:436 stop:597 length:162 start_codon:yes stop_codon:yes gene_type:complete
MEDSLKVVESPDGGLIVEWHPDDPRYRHLNGISEEELNKIIKEGILKTLEETK